MLTAIIEANHNTLVVELPKGSSDLRLNLMSIGIRSSPLDIALSDEDEHPIRVKLFAQDDSGKHLCLLLTEKDSLATANMAAYLIETSAPAVKDAVAQRLRDGQYETAQDLITDIKNGVLTEGPVKLALYFPITGYLDDGEEPAYEVGDKYLWGYSDEIADVISKQQNRDDVNIVSYYWGNNSLKAKLVSATWTIEEINDSLIMGRVDICLREELTDKEKADLIDWVRGQNSDGAFECLEDHLIDTGYGNLAISLWHDGDSYFVCEQAELDEYIAQHNDWKMGVM